MALTYVATAADSTGTGPPNYYKTIQFTGCQAGDLLVVGGFSANYTDGNSTERALTTTVGTTSTWTQTSTSPGDAADVDSHAGWATVSTGGDITVRVNLRCSSGDYMCVAGWRVPAAEWSGTPTFTTVSGADADGQISVAVAATSTVLYLGGDWSASNPGTTNTPAGAENHTTVAVDPLYAIATRSWAAQTSGTRNYGPSGLSGKDYAVIVCTVPEAAGGNGDVTAVPAGVTAAAVAPDAGAALTVIGQTHLTG